MSGDDPARFFEAIARRYDRVYALDAEATRARMRRVLLELPPRSRVLDLGVGTGRELSTLQDAGHMPTGLDASPAMIAICERRARPVPLVLADLWAPLPFADASFDACIALHGTLAHPTREGAHEALVRELARVLRADGAFVAEVPSPALLAMLDTGPVVAGDMTMRRVAEDRVLHEDRSARVAVEAVILAPARWESLFAGAFTVTVEPLGALELLVVARRR
jgi:SAM-dependent methyltransferase